jgi:hypothetical protein
MENATKGWEHYMYHKVSPLFDMKVPKIEPIIQLLEPNCIHMPFISLASNNEIVSIYFFQQGGILVFITQGLVLFVHFLFDLLFCVCI